MYEIDSFFYSHRWGTTWGINGYGKINRIKYNNCEMGEYAMYPNAITKE